MIENLDHFDLLSKEPIYLSNVGGIISPQLKDIHRVGNTIYNLYVNLMDMDVRKYYEFVSQTESDKCILDDDALDMDIYDLIIINDNKIRDMVERALEFFMLEKVTYNDEHKIFVVYNEVDEDENPIPLGVIHKGNYQEVCNVILQRNYVKSENQETEPKKYKNALAKKLAERMEKASKKKADAEKEKNHITFGKIVSKYCAVNKNGINMLNVFDLTIYQFLDQWSEYNNIRQADVQDMVYANTASFSDLSVYDPQVWLK